MNIPEILVANGTGIILVAFLFLLRVRNSETKQIGAILYDGMLAVAGRAGHRDHQFPH